MKNKQIKLFQSSKGNFLAASLPHNFQFFQCSLVAVGYEQSIEFMLKMWMRRFESSFQNIQIYRSIFCRIFEIAQSKIDEKDFSLGIDDHVGSGEIAMYYATIMYFQNYLAYLVKQIIELLLRQQRIVDTIFEFQSFEMLHFDCMFLFIYVQQFWNFYSFRQQLFHYFSLLYTMMCTDLILVSLIFLSRSGCLYFFGNLYLITVECYSFSLVTLQTLASAPCPINIISFIFKIIQKQFLQKEQQIQNSRLLVSIFNWALQLFCCDWAMLKRIVSISHVNNNRRQSMFGALRINFNFSIRAYNPAKNYYKILNVSENADQKDIKKAFRELAKKYHPDSAKGKEELFKEVNEAYQVLSDDTIKKEYDQVRANSNPQKQQTSYQNSSTYQQSYNNQGAYRQQNQYRGYQPQQGWNNKNFRQQFMYDLYRQQQNEYMRNQFEQAKKEEMERMFRERMRESMNKNINQTIRQYNQQAKTRQAEMRRKYEEQERRRREEQYEEYRRYRDESYSDTSQKMKEQLNKMADNIASNVKDALRVGQQLKSWWLKFKQDNKRQKK